MAILNPGASSVSSTTYEGALVELLAAYRSNRIDNPRSNITLNIQNNAETLFSTATFPIDIVVSDSGSVTTSVVDETASAYSWERDALSDIKALNMPAQIFALANKIQAGAPATTDGIDRVTLTINTDTKIATINVNFVLVPVPGLGAPMSFDVARYINDFA
jgi:hypothetical protein